MAPGIRLELITYGLEIRCSIQLSYPGKSQDLESNIAGRGQGEQCSLLSDSSVLSLTSIYTRLVEFFPAKVKVKLFGSLGET